MQPSSYSFFVDSRKIPSRVSIPLSSGKRRSTGIVTAVDDAVLREDSFLVILLTRIRSDEGTPLPPGRTMPPSKSQSGQTRRQQPWQDHASKPKPKRSRPGPFFIPRSSSPAFVLYRPRRSSSISDPFFGPSKISEGFTISRLFGKNRSFLLRWAEVGEEEELNILTSTERQKIFSCQLRR